MKIDWKWLIIGMIVGVFVIPFVQAKLSRGAVSRNKV